MSYINIKRLMNEIMQGERLLYVGELLRKGKDDIDYSVVEDLNPYDIDLLLSNGSIITHIFKVVKDTGKFYTDSYFCVNSGKFRLDVKLKINNDVVVAIDTMPLTIKKSVIGMLDMPESDVVEPSPTFGEVAEGEYDYIIRLTRSGSVLQLEDLPVTDEVIEFVLGRVIVGKDGSGGGGGSIDSISINGVEQPIVDKNVNLPAYPTDNSQLANGAGYVDKQVNDLSNYPTNQTTSEWITQTSDSIRNDMLILFNEISDDIPTNNTELENGAGYVTKTVADLVNYYLKTEQYTKTEIDTLLSAVASGGFEKVEALPSEGVAGVIYLLPNGDVYDEYIWISGKWDVIGSTNIDLTNYYTKAEITALLQDITTQINARLTKAQADGYYVSKTGYVAYSEADKQKVADAATVTYVNEQIQAAINDAWEGQY